MDHDGAHQAAAQPATGASEDPAVAAAVAAAEIKVLNRKLELAEKQAATMKDVFKQRVRAFRESCRWAGVLLAAGALHHIAGMVWLNAGMLCQHVCSQRTGRFYCLTNLNHRVLQHVCCCCCCCCCACCMLFQISVWVQGGYGV
jgi:hypothetical protein